MKGIENLEIRKDQKKGTIITREQYKAIKKYDRKEMDDFLVSIYGSGYIDSLKDNDQNGAHKSEDDFLEKLIEVLNNTKGIGPKIYDKAMEVAREKGFI